MNRHIQKGFTLIELFIALSVAAILLTLAMPSFSTLTMNKRITTQTNDFIVSLALARAEALKRVRRVTVCPSANGSSCAGSADWEQGWIVFANLDDDATVDSGEVILQAHSALDGGNTLRGSANVASYISFLSSGSARLIGGAFQSGTLVLCDERGAGDHARAINLSVTGRSRVEYTAPDTCAPA
jgi:type IV fimbrial biogenesis protein FimT